MSDLSIFDYSGAVVRTVLVDGEVWFVAKDVATVLGYVNHSAALTAHTKGVANHYPLPTPGGTQNARILSEADVLRLIVNSKLPAAERFERWVFEVVLPEIRKTGSFTVESNEDLLARAVLAAQATLAQKDERIAELEPKAGAWDDLASSGGDYAVGDAAKMLARAGITTGQQRLFESLATLGWVRRRADRWFVMQTAVDAGYMAEKPQTRWSETAGMRVAAPPQPRVTFRGLERLRVRLGEFTQQDTKKEVA